MPFLRQNADFKMYGNLFQCYTSESKNTIVPLGETLVKGTTPQTTESELVDVLRYSQQDLQRRQREWELATQNQLLNKDKQYGEKIKLTQQETQEVREEKKKLIESMEYMK